ncbi:Type I restriction enzyme specificity protein MPN_089 [Megamonas hypermegale]|uniref:Type I restriction enzyme specificity protein MPN_089 n=1 Tax=Megamonas hypermegale TaxID=158847 RepID=A0A378PTL9_9FIRM|nr:restriction endonuclease subunit S [Megamonas hypermegale]STY91814.1 Type I restriction enzyme specificity protein MPN_089 [Megamonas hypermegale]
MNDIEITLSKMCDRFSSGKGINASKIKVNDKYPVFGGNGIRGYTDTYNFDGECAIIGRQGANCGNVIYFKGKGYMTEHAIIACAKSEYSTGYLAYKLKLMNLKQYQGQSAQPGLSVNTLSNIKVNLPKLIIQKKVFNILNLLDSKIELNNKINAELESMAKTIYDYWFLQFEFPNEEGKPYKSSGGKMIWNEELKREIPEGWETKRLSDIEPNIITGKTPSTKNENYYNGNIPFITISDVRKNMFIVNTEQTLSEEGAKTQEKKYIPEDALCVTCIASPGLVAFSTKLSQTNQQINSIIFEKNYNKLYLYYYLKNYFKYTTGAKTGNTFANMNKEDFSRILVLYPKTKLLTLFQDKTLSLIKLIKKNTIENQELTALRDFLLPLLMNGQVGFKEDKAEG